MAENIGNLFQWLIFLGVAFVTIITSLLVITRKNPIHSALFLVMTFLGVAVLYLLLQSQFIAIVQAIVYAGAIVMLIVFVLMLLDLEEELRSGLKLLYSKVLGGVLAVFFLFAIAYAVSADGADRQDGFHHAGPDERECEECGGDASHPISPSLRNRHDPSGGRGHWSGRIEQEEDLRRA